MENLEGKDNANESCNLEEKDIEFFKSASRSVIDLIQCIINADVCFNNRSDENDENLDSLKDKFRNDFPNINTQDFNNIQTSKNQGDIIKQLDNLIEDIGNFISKLSGFVINYDKNDRRETDSYIPKLFHLVHEIETTGNIIFRNRSQIIFNREPLKNFKNNLIELRVAELNPNSSTDKLKIQRLNNLKESENWEEISIPPYPYLEVWKLRQLVKKYIESTIG